MAQDQEELWRAREELRAEREELERQREELERGLLQLREGRETLNSDRLELTAEQRRISARDLCRSGELEEERSRLAVASGALEAERTELRRKLEEERAQLAAASAAFEEERAELRRRAAEGERERLASATLEEERTELRRRVEEERKSSIRMEELMEALERDRNKFQREAEKLRQEERRNNSRVEELMGTLERERASFQREVETLRQEQRTLNASSIEKLEQQFQKEREQMWQNVSALEKERDELLTRFRSQSETVVQIREDQQVARDISVAAAPIMAEPVSSFPAVQLGAEDWENRQSIDLRHGEGEAVINPMPCKALQERFVMAITRMNEAQWTQGLDSGGDIGDITERVEEIAGQMRRQVYTKGEIITQQGEKGSDVILIEYGNVQAIENGTLKRTMSRGDIFGERALLHDDVRTATTRVSSDEAIVWTMDKSIFQKISQLRLRSSLISIGNKGTPIFRNLSLDGINGLLKSATLHIFTEGYDVVVQGEEGSSLWVVESGFLEVYIDGRKRMDLGAGDYFGEGSLLTGEPRRATVRVISPKAEMWALDKADFLSTANHALHQVMGHLEKTDMFEKLPRGEIEKLLPTATLEVRYEGEVVVRQGDQGTKFFIVEHGELTVSEYGQHREVRRLLENSYFGEQALHGDYPEPYTVRVASNRAELWAIDRSGYSSTSKRWGLLKARAGLGPLRGGTPGAPRRARTNTAGSASDASPKILAKTTPPLNSI